MDNTKFGPPKGMRDWLPRETHLRQKLIRTIEQHYQLYGFNPIDTPALENIEVLQGKGGGENEKLMFEIVRRRDDFVDAFGKIDRSKLNAFGQIQVERIEQSLEQAAYIKGFLVDMGLRFDLTVPLARYVANHWNDLPKPFRCYHIGPVWRADRPQRGRFREFYQCDIDIVGGASDDCEVELLLATDRVLKELSVGKFKIRISDKGLLNAILAGMGVEPSKLPGMAVAIDKLDKQPLDQVWREIEGLGHSPEVLNKVDSFIKGALNKKTDLSLLSAEKAQSLWKKIESIRQRVHEVNPEANVAFDPLLVRGLDYYTGTIFEVNVEDKEFSFSIAGGGRYDGLIEKLGGPKGTPAVGISLGFERILTILTEKDKDANRAHHPRVYIANNGQPAKDIHILAESLRSEGIQVEACLEKKDFVKQMKAAEENGIEYAITDFKPGGHSFKVRQLSLRQDREMSLEELYDTMKRLSEGARG